MKPTVGRIVHYYDPTLPPGGHNGVGAGPYAAIITQVWPGVDKVGLYVFPPTHALTERMSVPFHDPAQGDAPTDRRYWTWPPRES